MKSQKISRKIAGVAVISITLSLMVKISINARTAEDILSPPQVVAMGLDSLELHEDGTVAIELNNNDSHKSVQIQEKVQFFTAVSSDMQNGKIIAKIDRSESNDMVLLNLSFGQNTGTMYSTDPNILHSQNITRIAILDRKANVIYSSESMTDAVVYAQVEQQSQQSTPDDSVYSDLMDNEQWYIHLLSQRYFENNAVDDIQITDTEEMERTADKKVEVAPVLQASCPTVSDLIQPCVHNIGIEKFMTAGKKYTKMPTKDDQLGYYMLTYPGTPQLGDVITEVLGFKINYNIPGGDPNNKSYCSYSMDIVYNYLIFYRQDSNKILCGTTNSSDIRIANVSLAMTLGGQNKHFFYEMTSNVRIRNGISAGPYVTGLSLLFNAFPETESVSLGLNALAVLFDIFGGEKTGNGSDSYKSWSNNRTQHMRDMEILTGKTNGLNRELVTQCKQNWPNLDDRWFANIGNHYLSMHALVMDDDPYLTSQVIEYCYSLEVFRQFGALEPYQKVDEMTNSYSVTYCL